MEMKARIRNHIKIQQSVSTPSVQNMPYIPESSNTAFLYTANEIAHRQIIMHMKFINGMHKEMQHCYMNRVLHIPSQDHLAVLKLVLRVA